MKWLSLGENCLPDDILNRHGLKSFSTPFSSGRTNIDYVLQASRSNFSGLMDPENLVRGHADGSDVVRSILYSCDTEIYSPSVSCGFEFTHHDVISNESHRASFGRKIERWIDLRDSGEKAVFLYHHRTQQTKPPNRLFEKLSLLLDDFPTSHIVFFYQEIVRPEHRHVAVRPIQDRLIVAKFATDCIWAGKDPNVFWARRDDDLVTEMLAQAHAFLPPQTKLGQTNQKARWWQKWQQQR